MQATLMQPLLDYYQLLQISPNFEPEALDRVYRLLSARYHPDNPHTGDRAKFERVNQAYETLSQPTARAAYDQALQSRNQFAFAVFESKEFDNNIDGEVNRRLGLLCLLYAQRRSNPEAAGLSILHLERSTGFPREHLLFTLWYLKEAELLRQEESTDFVITSRGVDYLEKNLSSHQALYDLMKANEAGTSVRAEQ